MAVSITDVGNEALESGYAVLTGGRNLDGHPVICFQHDTLQELQQCSTAELLLLLKYYVGLAGPKVAMLANMRDKWTEIGIAKIITAFDELQSERRGTITNAYIITPENKSKLRVLKRCLLRKSPSGRLLPFYKVHLFESTEDVFSHVDRSQLTVDFGGTLQYNHLAWVDFQRSYSMVIASAICLKSKMKIIRNGMMKLRDKENTNNFKDGVLYRQKEIRAKYESILEEHSLRKTILRCQDALERLDNPDEDPDLIQVHCSLVIETMNKLRDLTEYILQEVDEMDNAMAAFEDELRILAKLYECRNNTEEVKETIGLLRSQISDSTIVGRDITEATNLRAYFIVTALEPSKDIVACATSILKNLDGGSKTTQRTYNIAFEIAKELTQSIQPFTKLMNKLNEDYTKIHVFHAVLEKMIRWKSKASKFILNQLIAPLNVEVSRTVQVQVDLQVKKEEKIHEKESMNVKTVTFKDDCKHPDQHEEDLYGVFSGMKFKDVNEPSKGIGYTKIKETGQNNPPHTGVDLTGNAEHCIGKPSKLSDIYENVRRNKIDTLSDNIIRDCQEMSDSVPVKENNGLVYNTCNSIILDRPNDWKTRLKFFYRKHPPPKKKHIKLLTKFEPVKNLKKLTNRADTVSERTLFILSFVRKKTFKSEEIIRIQQWEDEDGECSIDNYRRTINNDACFLEVTLV